MNKLTHPAEDEYKATAIERERERVRERERERIST